MNDICCCCQFLAFVSVLHACGELDSESGYFKSALQSGKKSTTNPITCGLVNPDIFESDDVAKLCAVSYIAINPLGGATATIEQICRHYRALQLYCRGALGTTVNPDTIECVLTGEFDLNTLHVDGDLFESRKKHWRIQKYPKPSNCDVD